MGVSAYWFLWYFKRRRKEFKKFKGIVTASLLGMEQARKEIIEKSSGKKGGSKIVKVTRDGRQRAEAALGPNDERYSIYYAMAIHEISRTNPKWWMIRDLFAECMELRPENKRPVQYYYAASEQLRSSMNMADEEKLKLLKEDEGKYMYVAMADRKNDIAWMNWGKVLSELSDLVKPCDEKKELLKQALEKFENAVNADEFEVKAWVGWGNTLNKLANLPEAVISAKEKERLEKEAAVKFAKARELGYKGKN